MKLREFCVPLTTPVGGILVLITQILANSLHSPNIYNANVYSSSVALGSKPEYAVDIDFYEPTPTCFSTDDQLPDHQGYHWILLDFGRIIRNVREIRLVADKTAQEQDNLAAIDAFLISEVDISKQELGQTDQVHMKPSLSWNSPSFHYCSSTNDTERRGQTATIQCREALDGRWLAIRRKRILQVCLISIYVENAFEECFRVLPGESSLNYSGSVFRYVRHVTESECRTACMKAPNCDAMLFTQQRFSGTCQLVQSFAISNLKETGNSKNDMVSCTSEKCQVIVNDCHEGILRNMELVPPSSEKVTDTNREKQLMQDWKIQEEKFAGNRKADKERPTTYLLSVYFEGQLECREWNCGLIYVYSVNSEGTETLCTFINTEHITFFENTRLQCDYSTTSPTNATIIRLKWRESNPDGDSNHLQVNLVRGHVRISMTEPIMGIRELSTVEPRERTTTHNEPPVQQINTAKTEIVSNKNNSEDPKEISDERWSNIQGHIQLEEQLQINQATENKFLQRTTIPLDTLVDSNEADTTTTELTKQSISASGEYDTWIDFHLKRNETQFDQPHSGEQPTSLSGTNEEQRRKVLHYRGATRPFIAGTVNRPGGDGNSGFTNRCLSPWILLISIAIIKTITSL